MNPKVAEDWSGGSAAKTSTLFLGYNLWAEHGCYDGRSGIFAEAIDSFGRVVIKLLELIQQEQVELLYCNCSIVERRVIAFRFTSGSSYDQNVQVLLSLSKTLDRGIWEPDRDSCHHSKWLGDLPGATSTIAFQKD